MGRHKDLTGQKFNYWTVLGGFIRAGPTSFWRCQCACGQTKDVRAGHLVNGASKSCGCHNIAVIKARNFRHGLAKTRAYGVWKNMRKRCLSKTCPAYPNYGGRGIKICSRWADFNNFYSDMGDPPAGRSSIDRIDNDGNYTRSNCRWASDVDQANNTRTNRILTIRGKQMTMAEAARKYKQVGYYTIRYRLNCGWSDEAAVGLVAK